MALNRIDKNLIDPKLLQEVESTSNKIGNLSELKTTNKTDIVKSVNEVSSQLADTEKNFKSIPSQETTVLGTDIVDATGWTLDTNWSGDFATGFTHAKGATKELIKEFSTNLGTGYYQVEITVVSPTSLKESNSGFMFSLGGTAMFDVYEGNFTEHTYARGIQAGGLNNRLVIKPVSNFDGTITKVSIKPITGTVSPTFIMKDSVNSTSFEIKPTKKSLENVFMGIENAMNNSSGNQNVGIGVRAMKFNTSGFWNVGIGREALMSNSLGSRNVAIGFIALRSNTSGHRNIAIGPFALESNKNGDNNIALGADAMQYTTDGSNNVGIGLAALSKNAGDYNIAIGRASLVSAQTVNNNIAIGDYALAYLLTSARASVAIGHDAARDTTASPNIAIGEFALLTNTTGGYNVAIGNDTLANAIVSDMNIAIGINAAKGAVGSTLKRNTIIGNYAASALDTGADFNVMIGYSTGSTSTTGNNNILIGYNVQPRTPATNNHLNIGDAIFGNLTSTKKQIGIAYNNPSARLHLPPSTSVVGTAPLKFAQSTELLAVPETGAIEYDGTNLYFTDKTGARKTIAVVV